MLGPPATTASTASSSSSTTWRCTRPACSGPTRPSTSAAPPSGDPAGGPAGRHVVHAPDGDAAVRAEPRRPLPGRVCAYGTTPRICLMREAWVGTATKPSSGSGSAAPLVPPVLLGGRHRGRPRGPGPPAGRREDSRGLQGVQPRPGLRGTPDLVIPEIERWKAAIDFDEVCLIFATARGGDRPGHPHRGRHTVRRRGDACLPLMRRRDARGLSTRPWVRRRPRCSALPRWSTPPATTGSGRSDEPRAGRARTVERRPGHSRATSSKPCAPSGRHPWRSPRFWRPLRRPPLRPRAPCSGRRSRRSGRRHRTSGRGPAS